MKKSILLILLFGVTGIAAAQDKAYTSGKINYDIQQVVEDLEVPWGIAWLSDNRMLISERKGELLLIQDNDHIKVDGLPEVYARGQGGLMDITLHPEYNTNGWIYITYSGEGEGGGNTVLIRARLEGEALVDVEELFRSTPNSTRRQHFGGRVVFDRDGYLFLSLGERGNSENAQDRSVTAGSIVRLNDDGTIPEDNPFTGMNDIRPELWSYGHRNPQGLALHPETGVLYATEHGPMGGDELNLIRKGANYGWPEITYGKNYDGTIITDETKKEGMEQPETYWVPSIAPSSLMFVTSGRYPDWKGDALVGSLKFSYLERVQMNGTKVVSKEKMLEDIGRVRHVKEGPDGYIYVLVEGKGVFKIVPK